MSPTNQKDIKQIANEIEEKAEKEQKAVQEKQNLEDLNNAGEFDFLSNFDEIDINFNISILYFNMYYQWFTYIILVLQY